MDLAIHACPHYPVKVQNDLPLQSFVQESLPQQVYIAILSILEQTGVEAERRELILCQQGASEKHWHGHETKSVGREEEAMSR